MYRKVFAWFILSLSCAQVPAQSPEVAEAVRLSAQVVQLYQARRYQEALLLAQKALALREKNLSAEHPQVAEALHNLASVQFQLEDLARAQALAERAAKIYEKAQTPQPNELAATLFLLGGIHYARADYEKAVMPLQQALTLREKSLGAEHPTTLDTVLMLANTYHQDQKLDSAEFLYRGYVAAQEKLRPQDSGLAVALERLSCILWKKGDEDEAQATEKRSDGLRGVGGPVLKVKSKELKAKEISRPSLNLVLSREKLVGLDLPFFLEGELVVRVLVNENGEVMRACTVVGPLPIMAFYENAARQTRFSPFTKEGQAVKVAGEIKYPYQIAPLRRRN